MISGYDYFKTKCAPIVEEIKESEHIESIPDGHQEDEVNITQDDTDVRAEEKNNEEINRIIRLKQKSFEERDNLLRKHNNQNRSYLDKIMRRD